MKILVDAVGLQKVADLLRDYYHACNTQEDKNVILFDARTIVQKLLDEGRADKGQGHSATQNLELAIAHLQGQVSDLFWKGKEPRET